jgi:outer membrane protein OmpA-like peptidoglycan-associated protein
VDGGSGAGSGTGSGADSAAEGGPATADGTGDVIPALDAEKLEQALLDDGRVEIPDIYFTFDSDEIREESVVRLNEVAEVLKQHPDWQIMVEGHTDSISAEDYNLELSARRAVSVKNALVTGQGIDSGRLSTEGFGEAGLCRPTSP